MEKDIYSLGTCKFSLHNIESLPYHDQSIQGSISHLKELCYVANDDSPWGDAHAK